MDWDREKGYALLTEYTDNPNLVKHCLGVEAAMRRYARHFDAAEEKWGLVGLLHDFDYDRWPEEHPFKGAEILREEGCPEEIVRAILSHADYSEVTRESSMEKALYAVDELVGFIVAVALVRPSKSVHDVKVSSVTKKLKQASFARGVSRDDIQRGVDELGVDLREHIGEVIKAMQDVAPELGLD